jgi:glucarate dehydratase
MGGADLLHLPERTRKMLPHARAGQLRIAGGNRLHDALLVAHHRLGVELDREALARLHEQYLGCGIRTRDDAAQMRKHDASFTGASPRY